MIAFHPSSFILHPSSFPPWLLIAWAAALGGVIGSFLNVVVYRLPAGLSIVHPGSHCPKCNHRIRWFDNVPVLSWFLLRGRCRDCHAPISIRYPLVEAATMAMFLLLASAELFANGANMPRAEKLGASEFWWFYALHALLMSTLLAAALIECDGKRPPLKLFGPILVAGVLGWLIPDIRGPGAEWLYPCGRPIGPEDAVIGLFAGAILGWALGLLRRADTAGIVRCLAVVGFVLGWHAACGVALWTAVLGLPMRALSRRPLPWTVWLALGAMAWIVAWGSLAQITPHIAF